MSVGLRRFPASLRLVHPNPRLQASLHLRIRLMSTEQKSYEFIITSRPAKGVGLVQLNRPKALNALCSPLFLELNEALNKFDEDDSIGAIVITGSERAFAGMCSEVGSELSR